MEKKDIKNIRILSGQEVTLDMVMEALNLDWKTYEDEYHITEKQAEDYLKKNPYIYFVALIDEKLVGYINFSPIKQDMYEKIRTGNYIDTFIEKDDILKYEENKEYYNYFSSIVIDREYQGFGIANMLIDELKKFIVSVEKEKKIIIKKIIADVISDGGMSMASKLGLKVIKESNHNSKIAEWERIDEKQV